MRLLLRSRRRRTSIPDKSVGRKSRNTSWHLVILHPALCDRLNPELIRAVSLSYFSDSLHIAMPNIVEALNLVTTSFAFTCVSHLDVHPQSYLDLSSTSRTYRDRIS